MADAKTQPTAASIDEYLASKASPAQLTDCKALTPTRVAAAASPASPVSPSVARTW